MNEKEFHNMMDEQFRRYMEKQGIDGNNYSYNPNIGRWQKVQPQTVEMPETWEQHKARLLKDWEPHCNEASGRMFFITLINTMCANLRKRGLDVVLKEHDNDQAVLIVSWDRPGSRDRYFVLKNHDNKNYSWAESLVYRHSAFYRR